MLNQIICFVMLILVYKIIISSMMVPCLTERQTINIEKIYTSTISKQNGLYGHTIGLNQTVPCGIYEVSTHYGKAKIIVGMTNNNIAYLNFDKPTPEKLAVDRLEMWNIRRLSGLENDMILTYNKGCCKK